MKRFLLVLCILASHLSSIASTFVGGMEKAEELIKYCHDNPCHHAIVCTGGHWKHLQWQPGACKTQLRKGDAI